MQNHRWLACSKKPYLAGSHQTTLTGKWPLSPLPYRSMLTYPKREIEGLRLISTGLSGSEIAQESSISLNTMRSHTKNVYSKLGVNNRRAALRIAEQLNLL